MVSGGGVHGYLLGSPGYHLCVSVMVDQKVLGALVAGQEIRRADCI